MNDRMKFGLIIATVVLLLFFGFIALAVSSPFVSDGVSQMNGVSVAMWIVIILAAFFIIAIILALIISAVTWGQWLGDFKEHTGREDVPGTRDMAEKMNDESALHILDQRYARGEITRDEYVKMKDDLDRTDTSP
jgi:uncharacterized membrane protein